MEIIFTILLVIYIITIIISIIIDIKTRNLTKEVTDIAWNELERKFKIRTILLESELNNEDKSKTIEEIEKVLAQDYQSKTNTSKKHK